MLIAIQPDELTFPDRRRQSYSDRWIVSAEAAGHKIRLVDIHDRDIIEQLRDCDSFIWRFSISPDEWALVSRILPVAEKQLGLCVFPDWKTAWHYNDKVAQTYLLEAADIPIPRTWIFWNRDEAQQFCSEAEYPLVLKLAGGASSKNVRLVESPEEAQPWVQDLFGSGVFNLEAPETFNLQTFRKRLRPALRLLIKGRLPNPGRYWELQKNYVLFQEFLPNNPFDTRVTVIGNRAFAFGRFNRADDFRASGSGKIIWDPDEIDLEFVRLGFKTACALGTQSIAIDGLYRSNELVTSEISYTYAAWAVRECPGHWELQGDPNTGNLLWKEGQMWPQDAIMEDFLSCLAARDGN